MRFKIHKIKFFPEKKLIKKKCVPTLPEVLNLTHLFLFGLGS